MWLADNNKMFLSNCFNFRFSSQKWKTLVYLHHFQNQSLGTKILSRSNNHYYGVIHIGRTDHIKGCPEKKKLFFFEMGSFPILSVCH